MNAQVAHIIRQVESFMADKENCRRYVELLLPKLGDRAVVLTDNTLTHAEELADFLSWVRAQDRFWSRNVPIGNGMETSVRRPSGSAS